MLKHYDKAIMIMHQFATDKYFLHELLFHHLRNKNVKKVGGEDKKGKFLLKIITLAFLRSVLCKRLGGQRSGQRQHILISLLRELVGVNCVVVTATVYVLLGYRKPKVKCVSMNLQEKGLN